MEYFGGRQTIIEALRSGYKIFDIYAENPGNVDKELQSLADKKGIKIKNLSADQRENRAISQGYLAAAEDFNYHNLESVVEKMEGDGLLLVLDHLEDTHNLGAIIRTALCSGVNAVIIPDDRSVRVNSTVIKISAGAVFYMPVVKVKNIRNSIEYLKKEGYWIYGADMQSAGNVFNTRLEGKICLVVGNEGSGISPLVKKNCDGMVMIPQSGPLGSLNVSVATGVILYEIFRQRIARGK